MESSMSDPFARLAASATAQSRLENVFGLVTAKVDKIEDDGTYRLRFFGMNGQDDDETSAPARVMMPMAGGGHGVHFFPEKGDEVVVGFHAGETAMPIILGAVYNRDNRPPTQANQGADNNVRTIVSRSGHELTFDDTKQAEKVVLKTQGGHTITMDDSAGSMKITIASSRGHAIVLDDGPPGQISIQGPGAQIVLGDAGTISLDASAQVTISAPTITLAGAAVAVGSASGSSMIDGKPFALHVHSGGTISGSTGPVTG
jgi:uncharacterized protein involved in type VI secretion and phage assembly